jgi:hypothetical protein
MRHFVQYHNPVTRGPYAPGSNFGISTDKSVQTLRGDRVWLVTRAGNPPRYCLCETFIVEEIDRAKTGRQRNLALSEKGRSFKKPIPVDSAGWFPTLLRQTGNFAFGLQHIRDRRVIKGLTQIAAGDEPNGEGRPRFVRKGTGFGDSSKNRLVERAAVRAVAKYYEARGWRVESRETECLGYDLLCRKGSAAHHVEAKGIRGSICSFAITANEKWTAEVDPAFRLIAVTRALEKRGRRLTAFTGQQFLREFDFIPISFMAKPRIES